MNFEIKVKINREKKIFLREPIFALNNQKRQNELPQKLVHEKISSLKVLI